MTHPTDPPASPRSHATLEIATAALLERSLPLLPFVLYAAIVAILWVAPLAQGDPAGLLGLLAVPVVLAPLAAVPCALVALHRRRARCVDASLVHVGATLLIGALLCSLLVRDMPVWGVAVLLVPLVAGLFALREGLRHGVPCRLRGRLTA